MRSCLFEKKIIVNVYPMYRAQSAQIVNLNSGMSHVSFLEVVFRDATRKGREYDYEINKQNI